LMKRKVFPAWQYKDPHEIIERLIATSSPRPQSTSAPVRKQQDRYYTMARRVEIRRAVKRAMRGER